MRKNKEMNTKEKYGYNKTNYWETTAKESNLAFLPYVHHLGLQDVKFITEDKYSSWDVEFTYKGKKCICEIKKVKDGYGNGRVETEGYDLEKIKMDKILSAPAEKRFIVFVDSTSATFLDLADIDGDWKFQTWPTYSNGVAGIIRKKVYTIPCEKSLKIFK